MPDWAPAVDDLMTQRLRHCTDCGRPGPPAWVGVWDLTCGSSVAYAICSHCKTRPGGEVALRARLEARYEATV